MTSQSKNKFTERFIRLDRNLPLEKFIPVAFLVFLLCIIILTIITFRNIDQHKTDLEKIDHSNKVLAQLEIVNYRLIEIPFNKRGYTITGDKTHLLKFDSLVIKVKADIEKLKSLTSDNPSQHNLVFSLDTLLSENISVLNNAISDTSVYDINTGKFSQNQTDAIKFISANLTEINEITDNLSLNEHSLLKNRIEEAAHINSVTQLFIIFAGIFSFTVIGLSLFISSNLIKNKNESENLLKKSYGELENRVSERTSDLKETNEKLQFESLVRIKAEHTIRESEQRFREMADSSSVLVWITDKDKQFTYFNKASLDFTGRTLEMESGKGWTEGIHPDDLNEYKKVFKNSFDKKIPFEIEYRLRSINEEYLWLLDKGIPRYKGSEFAGYTGSCIDINERKKNERFLKIQYDISKTLAESDSIKEASGNLLKNICRDIGWDFGIFWFADEKNEYIKPDYFWSEDEEDINLFSELYNDSMKFSKGMGFTGTIFKEGKSMWTKDVSTDTSFLKIEGLSKKGWNSGLGIPISNGKETIAIIECFNKKNIEEKQDLIDVLESAGRQIGIFIERKKAEEKLKILYLEMEEKVKERTAELAQALSKLIQEGEQKEIVQNKLKLFSHAVKSIKDSVFITDLENNTIFVNEAFELTYGYYLNEISGKEIPLFSDKNISPVLRTYINEKTMKSGWRGEMTTYKKDGTSFPSYLSTSYIRDENGKVNSLVGICQDITEIKNVEEELRKTNEILIETQNELIYNEKLAALGRFSSGVAHEIRNPLANISSLSQLIAKTVLDEKNKRRLNYIISNVEIANKIIKNLLNFATPESLEFSNVNLSDMLNGVLDGVEARCKSSNIKIEREIPEDMALLNLDKLKLENVFMNFIANSIESMNSGGTLKVKVIEDKYKNEVSINIADTGIGIPEGNLDKILEPFFTTKDDGVGLGMGLSYQTIKLHKGKFNIKSAVGTGTEINVKLPIKNRTE
jgi:PAS domain S-box-containing protein